MSRSRSQRIDLAAQKAFWQQQLSGELPAQQFPTDQPRPPVSSYLRARERLDVSVELYNEMHDFCRRENVTLYVLLLGVLQVLLARHTGQKEVTVGGVVADAERWRDSLDPVLFTNILVLHAILDEESSVRNVLARAADIVQLAGCHRDCPFEEILQDFQRLPGNRSRMIFQTLFALCDTPDVLSEAPVTVEHFYDIAEYANRCDLVFVVERDAEALSIACEYDEELFEPQTVQKILQRYLVLLQGVVAQLDGEIWRLPMLTEAEKQQLLLEWNATQRSFSGASCVQQLFQAQVERTPEAVAVVCEDRQWTYQELNQRANQLAHYLREIGVGPETLVGLCMERSLELMVALMGILKAGGAYVPLDPDYPEERLEFMLLDAQVRVLLTQQSILDKRRVDGSTSVSAHPFIAGPTAICLDTDWPLIAKKNGTNPDNLSSADHLAYVIYTSGSTGKPKGAQILHGGLVNYLNYCLASYPINDGRGSLVHSSIAFDATITGLYAPLLAGKAVYLIHATDDLEALSRHLRQIRNFSLVKITPAHLTLLSQQIPAEDAKGLTHAFVIGGENLLADQIAFWQQYAPDTLLFNEYGPTETVVGCIVYEASRWRGTGSVPIGRPIANTQVYVLDRHRQPVPVGVDGELYLGGAGVARGYLNQAQLSAEKFIADPFGDDPSAKLYRTGDLVQYHGDGNLEFVGRIDSQVKVRGFRIELGEIEVVLSQHPAVGSAVVLAREDAPGDKRLVAYVILQPGATGSPKGLVDYLKEKLPAYMVPAAVVMLDDFPLTAHGKVDRKALPGPEQNSASRGSSFVGARNEVEETLARIWQTVLNVQRVGIRDNFFELGGSSLLAVQVHSRIREELQLDVPIRYLFQFPTVESIAVPIQEQQRQRFSTSTTRGVNWKYLREFQSGAGKNPVYMIPGGIGGEVDVELFFYARLAHFVGAEYPFYGLRPRGADGLDEPHCSVREMARDYLDEIRTHQPKGPYYLTGACIGGTAAYEMACRLEALGEHVAFLGLLDTVYPSLEAYLKCRTQPWIDHWQKIKRQWSENYYAQRLAHYWQNVKQNNWNEVFSYLRRQAEGPFSGMGPSTVRVSEPFALTIDESQTPQLNPTIKTFQQTYERALRRHRPRRYRGKVTLLNAEAVANEHGKSAGWERRVDGSIEEHILPGDHITLFRQDVKLLAAQLRECLERAAVESHGGLR